MKACLVCYLPSADDAETCANCGEASWGERREEPEAKAEAAEAPASEPADKPKARRR